MGLGTSNSTGSYDGQIEWIAKYFEHAMRSITSHAKANVVIQHGQSQAFVQLTFNVGQQELTISRHFERGKSQQAKLIIQRPGAQPEEVNRVRAVDERILKELGNLDGDNLRNSCFVEQKELGRIEALSLTQREQAIQKLLGLERLTQLMEQFKFRREQERELTLAQSYLRLARLQAEIRAASTEESELAERLDAVKVAVQVKCLTVLEKQREDFEKLLGECMARVQQGRERLNRCTVLKEFVRQCDQLSHQIIAISHTRTELLRLAREIERLDTIEQVELPQARVYLRDVSAAAEAVAQTVQARKRVQAAEEAVREAQRRLKELAQAEDEQRRREDELAHAQARVVQRRREAEVEQQRFIQQLNALEAKRLRLEEACASVKKWEAANGVLQALREELSATEAHGQAILKLQMEMQQRKQEVRNLEEAVARAEKETQQASYVVLLARAYEALTAWMRLKGVEMTLGGYATWHTELTSRRQEAEMLLATARTKARMPFIAGMALVALTVFALILGFLWPAAFALFAILLCGAAAAWLWYFRARKNMQQYTESLAQCTQELQRLDIQRQATIQAGGDPAALNQYEQQILASGLAVPSTLEAGRSLQEKLRQQLGTTQGNLTLQEAAQNARDNHIRLVEQLRLAHSAMEGIRQELYLAQQSSKPPEQLAQLKTQAAAQEKIVATDAERARQSLIRVAQWPTDSNALQTLLSTCQAELRTSGEAQKRQEKYKACKANLTNSLTTTSALIANLLAALNNLAITGLPSLPQLLNDDDISLPHEQMLTATLNEIRKALQTTLVSLDEQGTRNMLDSALSEQGKIKQQQDVVENEMKRSQQMIDAIFSSRSITHPATYTYGRIVIYWPLIARVSPDEESRVAENLEEVRRRLYAARQQESQLATELHHPGTPLDVEECQKKVDELLAEREICGWATRLLKETHDRIARRVLPITERNMQPLLQQLTGGRYRDVRLTPEDTDGQPGEMDYRIRVWDPAAGRFVAKNLFSGGTRDQCSLALRLAFALATLPQELGIAPGFIFLDEPLSAFDSLRAQALVELITTGTIAQQFNQVILISHQHAFDREAFHYHVRMDAGQIIESDLPYSEDRFVEPIQLQPVSAGSE